MIDAKEFLRTVKSLTGIQATPNVFKDATLTDDERMLVFWAASGRYVMQIGDAGSGVNVYMTQDGKLYRKWFISSSNGFWLESETNENGEDFNAARQGIAQRLIETVGSRPKE
jgi:hypothetical protein